MRSDVGSLCTQKPSALMRTGSQTLTFPVGTEADVWVRDGTEVFL